MVIQNQSINIKMEKVKQIREWLDGDQNYFQGIELYNAHAYGGRRIFPIKPTCPQCFNQLKAELENILQIAESEAEAKAAEEAAAKEAEGKAVEEAAAKEAEAKAAEEAAVPETEASSNLTSDYQETGAASTLNEELLSANLDEMPWPEMKSLFARLDLKAPSAKKVDVLAALKAAQLQLQTPA